MRGISIILKAVGYGFLIAAVAGGAFLWNDFRSFKQEKDRSEAAEAAARPPEAVRQNMVNMYSLTTCGYCRIKRQELTAAGIKFNEFFIDKDTAVRSSLHKKIVNSGVSNGTPIGMPVFEIGGKIILGNPPLSELIPYIKGK